jgi:predicted ATPase
MLYQFCREARIVQELAEAMIRISGEHKFVFYSTAGMTLRGWALVAPCPEPVDGQPILGEAQVEEGIGQIRASIAGWRAAAASVMLPYSLAYLAEAYTKAGKVQEGLSTLAEALAVVDATGCRTWEAELCRLKGELLLIKGDEAQAETCFRRAIGAARCQCARSWELRAVTSLSRLWQKHGKRQQAQKRLAQIYDWFTEGYDTADLQEAKTLLEELA